MDENGNVTVIDITCTHMGTELNSTPPKRHAPLTAGVTARTASCSKAAPEPAQTCSRESTRKLSKYRIRRNK